VLQEKQHNQFIQSVEGFSTDALRKTETVEKVVLPNAEGKPNANPNISCCTLREKREWAHFNCAVKMLKIQIARNDW
jgi:hypothetical protein